MSTDNAAAGNASFTRQDINFSGLVRVTDTAAFGLNNLTEIVGEAHVDAKNKLNLIRERGSAISIADMFDMQLLMNHLSQFSEMSTSVVSATQTAIMSMARNVKG